MFQKSFAFLVCAFALTPPALWAEEALPALAAGEMPISVAVTPETARTITLRSAIELALAHSPQLKSVGATQMASQGERRQARLLPNPQLSLDAENLAGSGAYRGTTSAEFTYGLSQLIEIGGKRSARQDVADKGSQIAAYDYEAARLDLIRDVTIAYAEAVAAQEQVKLADEQKRLASEVLQTVSKRVAAAAEPLIQKSKAEVALATSGIALRNAQRSVAVIKTKLAALWGQENVDYSLDASGFFTIQTPAPVPGAAAELTGTPDLARLDVAVERARANLDLEKANAIPDPTLSAGMRDFRESGSRAFLVSLSLPIPILNANEGNIEKAGHELTKSEVDRRATTLALSTDLIRATEGLQTAYDEADSLRATILPAAEKAFSLSRQGYQAGKFPYLEVLDAQRTLFETRAQYITALKDYHARRAEVERLTATPVSPTAEGGENE